MDQSTLEFLTGRFDKVEKLIGEVREDGAADRNRISVLETKVEPLVSESTFKRRLQLASSAAAGAIASGIVLGFRYIFGHR